jgi:hypothetical protein
MDSRSLISLRFAITHLGELIVAFRGFILGLDLATRDFWRSTAL